MSFLDAIFGGDQESSSTVSFPPWLQEAYQSAINAGNSAYDATSQLPLDVVVPPLAPEHEAAFGAVRQGLGQFQPYIQQGLGLAGAYSPDRYDVGFWNSDTASQYMDPYIQNVVDINKRESSRDFQLQRLAQGDAAQVAGAFGGARHGIIDNESYRNEAQNLADIQNRGLSDAYNVGFQNFNSDRDAFLRAGELDDRYRLQSANALGSLASLGQSNYYTDVAALAGVGDQRRGYEQEISSYYTGYPWQTAQSLASILQGTPGGAYTQTNTNPGPNPLSQIAGLGISAAGLGIFKEGGLVQGPKGYADGGLVEALKGAGTTALEANNALSGVLRDAYYKSGFHDVYYKSGLGHVLKAPFEVEFPDISKEGLGGLGGVGVEEHYPRGYRDYGYTKKPELEDVEPPGSLGGHLSEDDLFRLLQDTAVEEDTQGLSGPLAPAPAPSPLPAPGPAVPLPELKPVAPVSEPALEEVPLSGLDAFLDNDEALLAMGAALLQGRQPEGLLGAVGRGLESYQGVVDKQKAAALDEREASREDKALALEEELGRAGLEVEREKAKNYAAQVAAQTHVTPEERKKMELELELVQLELNKAIAQEENPGVDTELVMNLAVERLIADSTAYEEGHSSTPPASLDTYALETLESIRSLMRAGGAAGTYSRSGE